MKAISVALFAGMAVCASMHPIPAAPAQTFKEKVVYSFGNGTDGRSPGGGFAVANGILYGTTSGGGSGGGPCRFGLGCGTVFSFSTNSGAEKVLYSFCVLKKCADGNDPYSSPTYANGILYGTTNWGGTGASGSGTDGSGTLYSLDPTTGAETVVHSFCSDLVNGACVDGANPVGGPIDVNGTLYGTTQGGGANDGWGVAFALAAQTGAETVLHTFCSEKRCTDGAEPVSALIDVNGTLYGTTLVGGVAGCDSSDYPPACGTVYSVDPTTGAETVLYSFCRQGSCADGALPYSTLLDVNGTLYGTTGYGGNAGCFADFGCGTVFSLDPSTDAETVLYAFCGQQDCTDGASPIFTGLIDVNGMLYGMTGSGGGTGCDGSGCGTIFSINPKTGAETVLYAFCSQQNCTDGANPSGTLADVNGTLYGMTSAGGAYDYGTVFTVTP